ncbi:hypothetical protein HPG69_007568 [Diceros bicornis minor]|uniref:Interferon-induced transmembrane protein 3 n=1 Tax=Diceros bicornis minor TaxID=77932 RepID=A0A7J7ESD0_DICBM|nr:hypothetical protein HPG69_007568 [Diceros bicornis minor]
MNRTFQTFISGTRTGVPPTYEMLKEEHGVSVLGEPQSSAPLTTTVINIPTEISVPDHVVWSLFNTIFMNWCCLGFVAYAYSVKVGGCMGDSPETSRVWGHDGAQAPDRRVLEEGTLATGPLSLGRIRSDGGGAHGVSCLKTARPGSSNPDPGSGGHGGPDHPPLRSTSVLSALGPPRDKHVLCIFRSPARPSASRLTAGKAGREYSLRVLFGNDF